jgi:nucleotide-binding universal stress UspA family protein
MLYQKILVPLDGSELAECVLPHVEAIAKGCGAINVIFIRVVEPFLRGEYSFGEKELKRFELENREFAKEYLDQLVSRINSDGMNVQTVAITGKAVESITDYATKNEVDLIVIATHGRSGVSRWAQGSVADRLIRSSHVPVLMVRAPGCVPGI